MFVQYVYEVIDFSSQYGSDDTISYTACNLTGSPTVYPSYGDSNQSFAFRTYGNWWSSTGLNRHLTGCDNHKAQDFIEVKLEVKVCPFVIKVYESYNPGGVTRILGYNEKEVKWVILWNGDTQVVEQKPRVFTPIINTNNFLTDLFRIEFSHDCLDYYCELDAVEVTGTLVEFRDYSKNSNKRRSIQTDIDENTSEKFSTLPSEVVNLILSYLNLETLCRAAKVSTFFQKHCYDSVLYQKLNLKLCWHKVNNSTFDGLLSRCLYLQELNVAWCGSQNHVTSQVFINFILKCGLNLIKLDVSNCPFLDYQCLLSITNTSTALKEFQIRNCIYNSCLGVGLREIANLKHLQCLNLYRSRIDMSSIIQIVMSCTNLEHLGLGGCENINNYDTLAEKIGECLQKLKSIDLWRAKTLSESGIRCILEGCPDIDDFDIGWCAAIDTSSGCIQQLAIKCVKLKRLILSSIRTLSDMDLLSVAYCCPDLEQIDILGTRDITPMAVERFLYTTKKLRLLDVSFSTQISYNQVQVWKSNFPEVDIKRSFKPFLLDRTFSIQM